MKKLKEILQSKTAILIGIGALLLIAFIYCVAQGYEYREQADGSIFVLPTIAKAISMSFAGSGFAGFLRVLGMLITLAGVGFMCHLMDKGFEIWQAFLTLIIAGFFFALLLGPADNVQEFTHVQVTKEQDKEGGIKYNSKMIKFQNVDLRTK